MQDSPIPPRAERPSVLLPALVTAALVAFFGLRSTGGEALDLAVQSWFWDGRGWLIPKDAGWFHRLAYDGPKALLILGALGLIAVAMRPALGPAALGRRRALYLLACLALVPVVCTQLRAVSHMATPRDLALYGGAWEHRLLFETKPPGYPCHAFPAGHASGGFALVGLAFAWATPRARRLGAAAGLLAGGGMGLYQIARGEHFLSHTLVTAALAWLLAAALARLVRPSASAA